MPRTLPPLKIRDLWTALKAASNKSSNTWIAGKPNGPQVVYSPSLGMLRQVVEIAETYREEFTVYIALLDPGTVSRLLKIVEAAAKVVELQRRPPSITTEDFEERIATMKAAIRELGETLVGVEVP